MVDGTRLDSKTLREYYGFDIGARCLCNGEVVALDPAMLVYRHKRFYRLQWQPGPDNAVKEVTCETCRR